jgi:hypothetical protein
MTQTIWALSKYFVRAKSSLKISVWSHITFVGHYGSALSRITLVGHAASVGEDP